MTQRTLSLPRFLPILVLTVLPCLLLWRVVFLGEAFLPADLLRDIAPWRGSNPSSLVPWNPLLWDGMSEFYPWRLFYAQSLQRGWIPLWNPYQFCGTPFLANSQSAVFYPPNLIFALLPVKAAFGVSTLLHLILSGVFAYRYLRSEAFGLSRTGALAGAITWQLSAWQVSWLALPTFLCVTTWLPLALLLTDKLATRPTLPRALRLGVCLGLIVLGGQLQIGLYCLLFVTAYAVFRLIPKRKAARPLLGWFALAFVLMGALAAPQVLPAIELSRVSHRAGAVANLTGYQGYLRLALPPVNLITLFFPTFFGSPTRGTYWGIGTNGGPSSAIEYAGYVGALGLLLAFYGVIRRIRTPSVAFYAIAALIALLMALGTPLDALLYFGIPGFGQSGSPGRILVLWTFCASVLAGVGADALKERLTAQTLDRSLGVAFGVWVLAALIAFGYAALWVGQNAPSGTFTANLARSGDFWRLPAALLLGLAAVLYLTVRGTLKPSVGGGALVSLIAIDLLTSSLGLVHSAPAEQVYPVTPGLAFLQQHAGNERIMPLNTRWGLYGPPPAILPPNTGMVYGFHDTQGYDSLLTGQYMNFARQLDNSPVSAAPPENGNMVFTSGYESVQAQEAAARYLVSQQPLPESPDLSLAYQDAAFFVYENHKALSRVRVTAGQGDANIGSESPTRLSVTITGAGAAGTVTVADQWYPGWSATVNGKSAEVKAGPDVFRTLTWQAHGVSAAPLRVEMRYEPLTFRFGLYAFCLALGALAAALGWSAARRN